MLAAASTVIAMGLASGSLVVEAISAGVVQLHIGFYFAFLGLLLCVGPACAPVLIIHRASC